jgi:hypothetical protein
MTFIKFNNYVTREKVLANKKPSVTGKLLLRIATLKIYNIE